jgi:hypothetical protein
VRPADRPYALRDSECGRSTKVKHREWRLQSSTDACCRVAHGSADPVSCLLLARRRGTHQVYGKWRLLGGCRIGNHYRIRDRFGSLSTLRELPKQAQAIDWTCRVSRTRKFTTWTYCTCFHPRRLQTLSRRMPFQGAGSQPPENHSFFFASSLCQETTVTSEPSGECMEDGRAEFQLGKNGRLVAARKKRVKL